MEPGIIVLIVIAAFLFIWMAVGIKIIRPYQKGVVEQLGRYKSTYDPGLKFVIPIIQSVSSLYRKRCHSLFAKLCIGVDCWVLEIYSVERDIVHATRQVYGSH